MPVHSCWLRWIGNLTPNGHFEFRNEYLCRKSFEAFLRSKKFVDFHLRGTETIRYVHGLLSQDFTLQMTLFRPIKKEANRIWPDWTSYNVAQLVSAQAKEICWQHHIIAHFEWTVILRPPLKRIHKALYSFRTLDTSESDILASTFFNSDVKLR